MKADDLPVSSAGAATGFLSPLKETSHPKHGRSLSIPRSELSRTTLVEDNPNFIEEYHLEPNECEEYDLDTKQKKSFWDLIKTLFCLNFFTAEKRGRTKERKMPQRVPTEDFPSPWMQKVFVLGAHTDTDNQPIPQVAMCTIDTGNLQGNLVSREFVEKRLGYPKSSFRELTQREKRGAVGITEDRLIPEGAIYLTWYHSKSSRVFHDMRFLISPHPHADLVIGAHSIFKNNLLTVPNFMVGRNGSKAKDGGKTSIAVKAGEATNQPQGSGMTVANVTADPIVEKLEAIVEALKTEADHLRIEKMKAGREKDETREEDETKEQIEAKIKSIEKQEAECKVKLNLAEKRLLLAQMKSKLSKAKLEKKPNPETIKDLEKAIKVLEDELHELEGTKPEEAKKND